MLTIKNRAGSNLVGGREKNALSLSSLGKLILLLALLAGCTPAGPRALLEGKRLVDEGKYPQAIEKLRTATSLLGGTNALAWNCLGVAYQYAGEMAEAERAYQRALALNHDLGEVRFNLGCLWLAQNKLEPAKAEFTACTLRRPNAVEGFLKLGAVQLRTHEPGAAEKTFNDALRLSPQNPEALNGLGLARLQRGRAGEAAQCFDSALKQQPDYRPALLNLAIVSHQYLKDRQLALEKYREYLALKPPPPNAEALAAIVRQLEQELNPPARHVAANELAQLSPKVNAPKATVTNVTRVVSAPKPEPAAIVTESAASLPSPPPNGPAARYAYKSPAQPAPGNRSEAEHLFAQGVQAQQAHRLAQAMQSYRLATQLDPTLFEAHYNLGLTATEAGNLPAALAAYEDALAVQPQSLDARYNFALVLKQANCLGDAVNELERVLASYPNETRAHLALGNLYAQQFHQLAKARQHYLRVLELEPHNPQAGTIRFWLAANPP
ncbi:MAG: tetratricopeptide repeat protein [Verrucomicrobiota bacterium]|jgi:tetratricopeptide (TPR) repeat protein